MGSWDYFIELKIEYDDANKLLNQYNDSDLYKSTFHFGIITELEDNKFNAGISSVIDNFLPANILIFNFLSVLKVDKKAFYIKTNGIEKLFDFEKKSDFINFMFLIWEEKIYSTYEKFGVIILNQKTYYKIRNKLYKKYYKKFTSEV